jgi:plasmid stabilization system protein ParE
MKNIVISKEASDKIDDIYSSILERFNKKVADKFLNETFDIIKHASYYIGLGKKYRDNIRFQIVKKRTLVFYRCEEQTMFVIVVHLAKENWLNKI